MNIDYEVEVLENTSQNLGLLPITTYRQRENFKDKIYNAIKRGIDIIAGLIGTVLMIPLTLAIYIAHKVTKDERTNILHSI